MLEGTVRSGKTERTLGGDESYVVDQVNLDSVTRWWVIVDYGTTNPFHALLLAEVDGRLMVASEWRWDSRSWRVRPSFGATNAQRRSLRGHDKLVELVAASFGWAVGQLAPGSGRDSRP